MLVEYKKAEYKDIPLIYKLAEEIWHEHYVSIISLAQINYMLNLMYSPQALEKQMRDGHKFTIVYADGIPAGYISINEVESGVFFLNKFYILKKYRNCKLGEQLLFYVEEQFKPNLKIMRLFVNRLNFKSINFYFKTGFIIENVIDQDIGNGFFMNDFIMIKKYT